ncbi:MAG: PTS sugar transporter subunit IIB [Mycoplasmatales bacterium]
MKGIIHIRIDDRLIHGQVANFWCNNLNASRIMVINDEIYENELQKSVLRMATPSNVSSSILTIKKAVDNINADKYVGQRVFIVLKSPIDALKLLESGLEIKEINIGNLQGRNDTLSIRPNVNLTQDELKACKTLEAKQVKFTAIMVPGDDASLITFKEL